MKSILLVAHGSRKTQTEEEFYSILELVRELLPDNKVEGAFMSCNDNSIEQKLNEMIDCGDDEIVIVPYFLFSGNHVKNSIPFKVEKVLREHKDIKVTYKEAFGVDRRLAEIVVDKINS